MNSQLCFVDITNTVMMGISKTALNNLLGDFSNNINEWSINTLEISSNTIFSLQQGNYWASDLSGLFIDFQNTIRDSFMQHEHFFIDEDISGLELTSFALRDMIKNTNNGFSNPFGIHSVSNSTLQFNLMINNINNALQKSVSIGHNGRTVNHSVEDGFITNDTIFFPAGFHIEVKAHIGMESIDLYYQTYVDGSRDDYANDGGTVKRTDTVTNTNGIKTYTRTEIRPLLLIVE